MEPTSRGNMSPSPGNTTAPASKCASGAFCVAFVLTSECAHESLCQEPSPAGWETHLVMPEAGWRARGDVDACGCWGGSGPGPGDARGGVAGPWQCCLGDVDACGRWGGSGLEPSKDRGIQMSLEALGTRVLFLWWPQTGRGGVRTGEGMGRGPRIQGRAAFFSLVLGSADPTCGLNADPHFLLALLTFSHSRSHQPRTLTTETPRKSTRSWNRRGERGLGGRAVLGGGPYPRGSSWTKGVVCRDPRG